MGERRTLPALPAAGLACVVGAVVGGGVKIFGAELPVVDSWSRQVLLGGIGVVLIAAGVWRRPTTPVTRVLSPDERRAARDRIDEIVKVLETLQAGPERENRYAILDVDGLEGYYVQFYGAADSIYGELVSSKFLAGWHALSKRQVKMLADSAWRAPDDSVPNYNKDWNVGDEAGRRSIAREVIDALVNVYGTAPDQPFIVQFGEDAAASP